MFDTVIAPDNADVLSGDSVCLAADSSLAASADSTCDLHSAIDAGLEARVAKALFATGYIGLRQVDVAVRGGAVILIGQVPNYHLKQLAQSSVKRIPGVLEVDNRLDVASVRVPNRFNS